MKHFCLSLLVFFLLYEHTAHSQTVMFTSLVTGLSSPVDVVAPPDNTGRLFIAQKGGTVRIYDGTNLLAGNFLDISSLVSTTGERGLLSIAFHPDYATNRFFFIIYNNLAGDIVLARYRTQSGNPNSADASSGVTMLSIPHPGFANHNGGKLNFGNDGLLYWSTGDGGGTGDPDNNAQDGNSYLGKMLRVAPDTSGTAPYYSIPLSNPYTSDPNFLDEIWAFGLRNPWRWSFDRTTGDMWIADVGQGAWEEVNFTAASAISAGGLDFGWRCREGAHVYSTTTTCSLSFIDPVFEYSHTLGQSITGGYVYRGSTYPDIAGKYLCTDYVSATLWLVTPGTFASTSQTTGIPFGLTGFGEGNTGELYAVTLGGTLYSVGTPVATGVGTLLYFTHRNTGTCEQLLWRAQGNNLASFGIEKSTDGRNYGEQARVPSIRGSELASYEYSLCGQADPSGYYRLRLYDEDGSDRLSQVLHIRRDLSGSPLFDIMPNPVKSGSPLSLQLRQEASHLVLTDVSGRIVFSDPGTRYAGYHQLPVTALPAGTYLLGMRGRDGSHAVRRIVID